MIKQNYKDRIWLNMVTGVWRYVHSFSTVDKYVGLMEWITTYKEIIDSKFQDHPEEWRIVEISESPSNYFRLDTEKKGWVMRDHKLFIELDEEQYQKAFSYHVYQQL